MKKVISLISLLLLTLLLQGCVAGVIAAGAGAGAAGGSIASDNRTIQTITDDQEIAYKANRLVSANHDLNTKAHIVIVSYNKVVLMAGQAPTAALRDQAVDLVKTVPKVRRIFNEITVGTPTSAYRRSKDAAITGSIKTRMVATAKLKSSQIKVVTEDGTVFLLGLTTPQQAEIAGKVARSNEGVKQVVKLIEYIYGPSTNN